MFFACFVFHVFIDEIQDHVCSIFRFQHIGDGNSHVLLFFDPKKPEEVREAKTLSCTLANTAIEMGGTCTGEHGIGVGKKDYLEREMGKGSMSVMRKVKDVMDPQEILNPNKVLNRRA